MGRSRIELLSAAEQFCDSFAQKKDVDTILSHFSSQQRISAIEYGEPALAPFIGRVFEGESEIRRYFGILAALLTYENVSFSEYVVDSETGKVAVKGRGTFTWIDTRESWDEVFSYVLDFDEGAKVVKYQVWADSGAAFLASRGQLSDVRRGC